MSIYFSYLPDTYVRLDSFRRQGVDPYIVAKNLFRRIKIRDSLKDASLGFQQYSIGQNERPDQVAIKAYGDMQLDWVVLISNNIINMYEEWPMHEQEMMDYTQRKYDNPEGIHHYETLEIKNKSGDVVIPAGTEVNHNYTYTDSEGTIYADMVIPITNFEYEVSINDYKRNIYLLKPEYLTDFVSEFEDLCEYLPHDELDVKQIKKTFAIIDENYLTTKTTYSTDIGRSPVTKKADQADYADREFTTTAASGAVLFNVAEQQSGTVNDSGVAAGTQDSGY
tara:strand:+ start:19092 stop:19931 length:840 start_codon:yes stop_codon:yes gene_type:complete